MPSCPACGQDVSAPAVPCPACGHVEAPVEPDRLAPPPWLAARDSTTSGPATQDPVPPAGPVDASVRPPPLAGGDPGDTTDPLAGWDIDPSTRGAGPSEDGVDDWMLVAGAGMLGVIAGAVLTRRVGRALATGVVAAAGAGARRRVWETPPPDDSWARTHAP